MKYNSLGFTIVELILVISIVSALAAFGAPLTFRFYNQNTLDTARTNFASSVRRAQNNAMDGRGSGTWGVCIVGTSIRMFEGTCNTPTYSETYSLGNVAITGFTQVTFSTKRGEPNTSFSANLSNSAGVEIVSMNASGGMGN